MEDDNFKFKIFLEKNGEQREVKLVGSIGDQLDLLRAHGGDLEPQFRKFFGDRVFEAIMAWDAEESEKEKIICNKYQEHYNIKNNLASMPEEYIGKFYNACTDPCDMLQGPCACGATHHQEEWPEQIQIEVFGSVSKIKTILKRTPRGRQLIDGSNKI